MAGKTLYRRLLLEAALLASCLLPQRPLAAEPVLNRPPSEYQVKAAFLLNFARFVEWPASVVSDTRADFPICILGQDPFGSVLDQLVQGETVDNRRLVVRHIHGTPSSGCMVLFVSNSEKDVPAILNGVGPGILTVGDGDAFVHDGGMIGFVLDHRRVRFDINQSAAAKAALKLSSKLLNVARAVEN